MACRCLALPIASTTMSGQGWLPRARRTLKLEGMKYREKQELTAHTRARRKKAASRKRPLR